MRPLASDGEPGARGPDSRRRVVIDADAADGEAKGVFSGIPSTDVPFAEIRRDG